MADWAAYLAEFHRRRPGITEDLLGRAGDGLRSPYMWLVEALDGRGPVLDVACGSGPLLRWLPGTTVVGVDRSAEELTRFRAQRAPAVLGDAARLPVRSASCASVTCSMALMVLQPLSEVLGELARVMSPGATGVALLPGRRPLRRQDLLRYGQLMLAVRRSRLRYPNDGLTAGLARRLADVSLRVVADDRHRFALPLVDARTTRAFVESLYLPGCPPERIAAAATVASTWVGSDIGIPLRRLVFTKPKDGPR